jgi:hypothetical protein
VSKEDTKGLLLFVRLLPQRFITHLDAHRFSYLLGVKQQSHKTLFEDIEGLRRAGLLETIETTTDKGHRCVYEWV